MNCDDLLLSILVTKPVAMDVVQVLSVGDGVSIKSNILDDMVAMQEQADMTAQGHDADLFADMREVSDIGASRRSRRRPAEDTEEALPVDEEYVLPTASLEELEQELKAWKDTEDEELWHLGKFQEDGSDNDGSSCSASSSSSAFTLPGLAAAAAAPIAPLRGPAGVDWASYRRFLQHMGKFVHVVNEDGVLVGRLEPFTVGTAAYTVGAVCFNKCHKEADKGAGCSKGKGKGGQRCSRMRSWKPRTGEDTETVDCILAKWLIDGHHCASRRQHKDLPRY